MNEGTIVAALTAMAFVMVGIFQFLRGYITSSNKEYLELLEKYEKIQAKVLEMEINNLLWKNRAIIERTKTRDLQDKLNRCNETMTTHLTKNQSPVDPDEDDTFYPDS